jgi:multiple sugar transport system permease protein
MSRTRHPVAQGTGLARWVLSAPLLVLLVAMVARPLWQGIRTAMSHDLLSQFDITPAGFENFSTVIHDPNFWGAAWFTVRYAVSATLLAVLLGFGLALLLDRVFPLKRWAFSAVLVPIMIAPSLMGVMYRLLLNENVGVVPAALAKVDISLHLFSGSAVVPLLITLDVLQYLPFAFLLFYSSLQSFPTELHEAAAVDGAGYWRTVRSVVVPVLAASFIVVGLLRLLDALRTFDVVYVLTGGGPGTMTNTLGIYIYKKAFVEGDFGVAAASALVLVLLLMPLIPAAVRRLTQER